MLNLIETELLKLRRKKMVWLMLLAALVMPFFTFLYYHYFEKGGADPMAFYKRSAFGFTPFMILPFVLGVFCTVLMHDENRYNMLKQIWIVPVSRMGYFFSKFALIFLYAIVFMMLTAIASVLLGVLPGFVAFDWQSVLFLFRTCLELAVLAAFGAMPILAIATTQKGYILPVCVTLLYIFLGFFMTSVNMYLHPLSSMSAVIASSGKIPGLNFTQDIRVWMALLCILVWDLLSVLLARVSLSRR